MKILFLIVIAIFTGRAVFAEQPIWVEKYNHDMHTRKVFKPLHFKCSNCHNFHVEEKTGKVIAEPGLKHSTFKLTPKMMCHQCHRSPLARFAEAPKTCYTCHSSMTRMRAIRPKSHNNVTWKTSHATEARIDGDYCLKCHDNSQCVKCHSQRNDIEFRNHSRNFRFMHSIEARLRPQECDTCHTKSFCVDCHLGKK